LLVDWVQGRELLADLQRFRILTLLIFHNPVSTRARHAATRHHPGEAGVWRAKLAAGRKL
jgi:hypothetical protein